MATKERTDLRINCNRIIKEAKGAVKGSWDHLHSNFRIDNFKLVVSKRFLRIYDTSTGEKLNKILLSDTDNKSLRAIIGNLDEMFKLRQEELAELSLESASTEQIVNVNPLTAMG